MNMNKRRIKKINRTLSKFADDRMNDKYNMINFIFIEEDITDLTNNDNILLDLLSEKFDEENLLKLIIFIQKGYYDFRGKKILNAKNENGENLIQVAIKTGYSHNFIIELLKEFGSIKSDEYNDYIDCNNLDKFENTILHTALKSKNIFYDYCRILFSLFNYTNFDLSNNGDGIIELAENTYEELCKMANFLPDKYFNYMVEKRKFLSLIYFKRFDLFMKRLTDDVNKNIDFIYHKLDFPNFEGIEYVWYPHQLLHLCVNKKYDEELVLKSIKRLIATGKMDVNYLENGLDIVSVAIINGYSNEFIIKLIKELSNNNFDKKYYFQIMCSAIYLSEMKKRDVLKIYNLLVDNGFNLINEKRLIDEKILNLSSDNIEEPLEMLLLSFKLASKSTYKTLCEPGYNSLRDNEAINILQRENNIADFLKKIIACFKTYNIDIKIDNLRDYDECYRRYVALENYLLKEPKYVMRRFNLIKSIVDIINKKYVDSIMYFNSENLKDELINTFDLILEHHADETFLKENMFFIDSNVYKGIEPWFVEDGLELESASSVKELVKKYKKN